MNPLIDLKKMGEQAKQASYQLANAPTRQKNEFLKELAADLIQRRPEILQSNQADIEEARQSGLGDAMLDRLSLQGRLECIEKDLLAVSLLPDPIGEIFDRKTLPNGLKISKRRTPIGVLGAIYEARPNVTIDMASLIVKTGNCAILRGGSETLRTNQALVKIIQDALIKTGLPIASIQLIESQDRALVKDLLRLHSLIDLIIPRGGAELHRFCRENSAIPVIAGGVGVCHLFVDKTADSQKAIQVILNAKTQRPTVCNALDTLLVHEDVAVSFIPPLIQALREKQAVFRLDEQTWNLLDKQLIIDAWIMALSRPDDWDTEWLSLTLGIKIVKGLEEAIDHIRRHGTGHSDGILTRTKRHAEAFIQAIDSAVVYVNSSTRFTDGSQFGLGAEAAISTQKLHARGPMGLKELTTYKWIVRGDYHIRT